MSISFHDFFYWRQLETFFLDVIIRRTGNGWNVGYRSAALNMSNIKKTQMINILQEDYS